MTKMTKELWLLQLLKITLRWNRQVYPRFDALARCYRAAWKEARKYPNPRQNQAGSGKKYHKKNQTTSFLQAKSTKTAQQPWLCPTGANLGDQSEAPELLGFYGRSSMVGKDMFKTILTKMDALIRHCLFWKAPICWFDGCYSVAGINFDAFLGKHSVFFSIGMYQTTTKIHKVSLEPLVIICDFYSFLAFWVPPNSQQATVPWDRL